MDGRTLREKEKEVDLSQIPKAMKRRKFKSALWSVKMLYSISSSVKREMMTRGSIERSAGCFGIRNNFIPNVTPTCSCFSCMCPLPPSCQHDHILDQEVPPQITPH